MGRSAPSSCASSRTSPASTTSIARTTNTRRSRRTHGRGVIGATWVRTVFHMRRPFLVSNRLPVRVVQHDGKLDVVPSAGGVASALRDVQIERGAHWLGWPGDVPLDQRDEITTALTE